MTRPSFNKLVQDTSNFITSGRSSNGKSFTQYEKLVIFMIWASGNQSYAHTAFGLGTGFTSIGPVIIEVIEVCLFSPYFCLNNNYSISKIFEC